MNRRHDGEDPGSHRRFTKSQERSAVGSTGQEAETIERIHQLVYKYDLHLCLHRAANLCESAVQTDPLLTSVRRVKKSQPKSLELQSTCASKRVSTCSRNCARLPSNSGNNFDGKCVLSSDGSLEAEGNCISNGPSNDVVRCNNEGISTSNCSGAPRRSSFAVRNGNASNNENWDSESELLQSGFFEGPADVDLDAMKSAISRLSIYEEAFFNEGQLEELNQYFKEPDLSKLLSQFRTEMTEVHLSPDQTDGSEIIAPSWHAGLPFSCLVSAWFDCRRHWLASLGHDSAAPSDSARRTELSFSTGADSRLLLRLSFQPDGTMDEECDNTASTGLVFKLSRLANNLRRYMYSRSRSRGQQKKS